MGETSELERQRAFRRLVKKLEEAGDLALRFNSARIKSATLLVLLVGSVAACSSPTSSIEPPLNGETKATLVVNSSDQLPEPTDDGSVEGEPTGTEVDLDFTKTPEATPDPVSGKEDTMIELGDGETIGYRELMKHIDKNAEPSPFHEKFAATWYEEFTGESKDGFSMNFVLGLSDGVINDSETPVSKIIVSPEERDVLVDVFVHLAHFKYTEQMGNDISYEEYIKLLSQPEGGEIVIPARVWNEDSFTWSVVPRLYDPRAGFSVVVVDNTSMPFVWDGKAGAFNSRNVKYN